MPLTTTSVYNGGVLQRTDKTIFHIQNNHDVPHYETTWISSGFKDTLITYNSFSDSGLPTKITRKGEPPTRLFWNSKGNLLASVTSSYIGLQCTELIKNSSNPTSQPELSPLNVIKKNGVSIFDYPYTKAIANIYYFNGLLYMSATGNGSFQYYYYDQLGRLTEIRDQNKKVIQRFTYNYSNSSAQ
jgi:YD repeat-containing protein